MNKERFKKFYNSLAFNMTVPLTYVPIYTFMHQFHDYGFGVVLLAGLIGFTAFYFSMSYLLFKLIGDVGYLEVDQDRRLRGFFSLFVVSILLMAVYEFFFEETEPVIRWTAWAVMVIILFIGAYSISKQYIIGKENIKEEL